MTEPERITELGRLSDQINQAVHARMDRTGALYKDALVAEMRENPEAFSRLERLMAKHQQLTVDALGEAKRTLRAQAPSLSEGRLMGNDWDEVQVEICDGVKRLMSSNSGWDYPTALRVLLSQNSDLSERYNKSMKIAASSFREPTLQEFKHGIAASEIHTLVEKKLVASEGRTGYRTAFQEVLAERPDLALGGGRAD